MPPAQEPSFLGPSLPSLAPAPRGEGTGARSPALTLAGLGPGTSLSLTSHLRSGHDGSRRSGHVGGEAPSQWTRRSPLRAADHLRPRAVPEIRFRGGSCEARPPGTTREHRPASAPLGSPPRLASTHLRSRRWPSAPAPAGSEPRPRPLSRALPGRSGRREDRPLGDHQARYRSARGHGRARRREGGGLGRRRFPFSVGTSSFP